MTKSGNQQRMFRIADKDFEKLRRLYERLGFCSEPRNGSRSYYTGPFLSAIANDPELIRLIGDKIALNQQWAEIKKKGS